MFSKIINLNNSMKIRFLVLAAMLYCQGASALEVAVGGELHLYTSIDPKLRSYQDSIFSNQAFAVIEIGAEQTHDGNTIGAQAQIKADDQVYDGGSESFEFGGAGFYLDNPNAGRFEYATTGCGGFVDLEIVTLSEFEFEDSITFGHDRVNPISNYCLEYISPQTQPLIFAAAHELSHTPETIFASRLRYEGLEFEIEAGLKAKTIDARLFMPFPLADLTLNYSSRRSTNGESSSLAAYVEQTFGGINWVAGYQAYDNGYGQLSLSARRDCLLATISQSRYSYWIYASYLCELGDDFLVLAGAEYSQDRHVTGSFGAGVRF